jgi:nucleotide-binding universal stress UspA family protein
MLSTVAVGTDGSSTAEVAVEAAAELARRFEAELVLISASQDSGRAPRGRPRPDVELQWAYSPAARLREMLARTEQELANDGVECRTLIDEGDAADVLVRLARECEADLLVIGNRGMDRRLLGSVPNSVTHRAPCSVLVVKTT